MQIFMVTGLFAGQHNTKLHGTNAGVIVKLGYVKTIDILDLDYM